MRLSIDEVVAATSGHVGATGSVMAGDTVARVRTDSRQVSPGDLFVAVQAERDGHDFIDAARQSGAAAWLTMRADDRPGAILVRDTTVALAELGTFARTRIPDRVIGVTGSSGKTSTKDLIAAILRTEGPAAASEKSFNNELGVPLTLLDAPDGAVAAVVEMGARGIGHIAALCRIARPTVGIVTNVGLAHLAMYDAPEGIVTAKAELVQALPRSGVAVLNADDQSYRIHAAMADARVVRFGNAAVGSVDGAHTDVWASGVTLDGGLRPSFRLHSPWGEADVTLGARGRHQVSNALAAAAATLASGSSLDHVVAGLGTQLLSPWRMDIGAALSGATLINDSYNANPDSMAAALRSLADVRATRRIAVLGTMAELGDAAPAEHARLAGLARELGIDVIIAVAEPRYGASTVDGIASALDMLSALSVCEGDVILVKGSRVAGLEHLAAALTGVQP